MIVGFEGKKAMCNATGLGNYSRFVIDALSAHYPQDSFKIYSPCERNQPQLAALLQRNNVSLQLPARASLGTAWWRTVSGLSAQAKRDGVQLLHGLSAQLPLDIGHHRGLATVVTVHDLIYCRYPQYYDRINRNLYRRLCLRACQNATRIVAVSECTKRDIVEILEINPDKIDVVYQGCNTLFSQSVSDDAIAQVRQHYQLPQRYLLNVGTVEERKNALVLVNALERLKDKNIGLVIVGRKTAYAKQVENRAHHLRIANRVYLLGNVPINHLPALYHGATAFAYPSRYEGFGIPIIEAQHCAVPVIAATGSCLEEAAGDAALMVHPNSVEQMTNAMEQLLEDSLLRQNLVERGRQNVKRFTPKHIAHNLMNVYQCSLSSI